MISVFNVEELQSLLEDLYHITRIRITVFDSDRNELVSYPENCPSFCSIIRGTEEGRAACAKCDKDACDIASRQEKAYIYHCHAGLTEAIMPLYVGKALVGYLLFGHVFAYNSFEEGWEKIRSCCEKYPIDLEKLRLSCQDSPLISKNYIKSGNTDIAIQENNASVLVALIWVMFNGIFGALYMAGILDDGIMILLACAYSVCDVVCILFFCPFQTWFLKNKCCCTCRIYNWDYAMMFTPLFFVQSVYTWSLLGLSLLLLMRWEITFFRYPERFSDKTNAYLSCSNCSEKLCSHKRQLAGLWKDIAAFTENRLQKLR